MKKIIIILLVCICIISFFLFSYVKENFLYQNQDLQQSENTQVASWKDANFEKLVRIYLGKTDEDILISELEDITELRIISNSSIETNLKKLEIPVSDQQSLGLITSMADVDNFINLKKIEISSNHIESIENVKISPNITELDLTFNKLNDNSISEIKNYTAIESLNLSSNHLENISILKELKSVRELNLGYTGKIADNIFGCVEGKIDFSVIKELSLLEELYIPFSIIENIEQLNNLSHLKTLNISQASISEEELIKVKELQGLEELMLYRISIIGELETHLDLSIFSDMKRLKKLTVSSNIYNADALNKDVELKIVQ